MSATSSHPVRARRQLADQRVDQPRTQPLPPMTRLEVELVDDVVGSIATALPDADDPTAGLGDDDQALVADRLETQLVGTPGQVADRLEQLQEATDADELIVTTITHDHADRVRSYELLAQEWAQR